MSKPQWEEWSDESVKEQQKAAAKAGGSDIIKLAEGDNVLRFLPATAGSPFKVIYQHYVKTGANDAVSFSCPLMMEETRCVICERSTELDMSRAKADRDYAWELKPKLRVFANVVDMNDQEGGVRVLAFGKSIWEGLLAIRKDAIAGGDFTHPEKGFDIVIKRTGTGMATRYKVLPGRKSYSLPNWDVLTQLNNLGRYDKLPTREDMVEALNACGGEAETVRTIVAEPTAKQIELDVNTDSLSEDLPY